MSSDQLAPTYYSVLGRSLAGEYLEQSSEGVQYWRRGSQVTWLHWVNTAGTHDADHEIGWLLTGGSRFQSGC